jgi:hypothetical protein
MSDEEILEVGPRRIPRWLTALGVLVALGLAGWGVTRLGSDSGSTTTPAAASPLATAQASAPSVVGPFDSGGSVRDQLLAEVFQQAHDPTPAQDVIRTGGSNYACTIPSPHRSPRDALNAVVHDAFPGYALIDEARVIDRFAGLCVLDLRARERHGTVLVVRIAAPVEDATLVAPRLDDGEAVAEGTDTQFVRVSTHDGWVIVVGSSGPPAYAPDRDALLRLAQRPSVRW